MDLFGFVPPPAVPLAVPIATGLLGAAAALLKPILLPPPGIPGAPAPGGDGLPLGAANTQTGGGQPLEMGSNWTDKARDVEVTVTATVVNSQPFNSAGDPFGSPSTRVSSRTQVLRDVFGFEVKNNSTKVTRTAGGETDVEIQPGTVITFWRIPDPAGPDDQQRIVLDSGDFQFLDGVSGANTSVSTWNSRSDEIKIDGKLFPIPHLPAEKPVIREPELFVEPEPEPEPNRIAPPLPGSPPPLPAKPPLPQPVPDAPPFPVPGTPAQPDPSPGEDPATRPSPAPEPSAPPQRLPASPVPQAPPALDPAVTQKTGADGGVITGKPGLVKSTPADAHFPSRGGPAIRGGTANPSPTQIAQELSRVEAKLTNFLDKAGNNKPDWILDLLRLLPLVEYLFDLFSTPTPSTDYQVTESCAGKDYGDNPPPSRTVIVPGADDPINAILNRVDALSDLAQANFDLKVNTCKSRPKLEGKWVTVNFRSIENSPNNNRPLRKLLRYRDLSGSSAADHSRHWDGFEWEAGPVCVIHSGAAWGVPQCWAASESEGQRVIRFAASIAGIDPDTDGQWQASVSGNPRYGQPGRMMVEQIQGFNSVSQRDGPNGPPTLHA